MREKLQKFALKIQKFMTGRYGNDQLNRALIIFYIISLIITNILFSISKIAYYSMWVFSTTILVFTLYRTLSKDIEIRRSENQSWLRFTYKIKSFFKLKKDQFSQRKEHKFVKCKKCKAVLRLPKNKGKISVSCPKCHNQFIINTGKKK